MRCLLYSIDFIFIKTTFFLCYLLLLHPIKIVFKLKEATKYLFEQRAKHQRLIKGKECNFQFGPNLSIVLFTQSLISCFYSQMVSWKKFIVFGAKLFLVICLRALYYLFRDVDSFPRAILERNCELVYSPSNAFAMRKKIFMNNCLMSRMFTFHCSLVQLYEQTNRPFFL